MYDWATIYPDGSMLMDGFVPMKWRLLHLTDTHAVIHSPGGSWWDNGGKHYGEASVDVKEIEELRPGNAPGTWRLKFKRLSKSNLSFHPTPKEATRRTAYALEHDGEAIAARIAKRAAEARG